jgi:hypothetical protein
MAGPASRALWPGRLITASPTFTAQDYAQGDAGHRVVVWLRYLLDQMDDLASLTALAAEVPEQTLALREFAAVAQERISAGLAEAATKEAGLRPLLASARNDLANRLSDLGRREEALTVAEEAVALYRELAGHRPDLAVSLSNLATMLSDLGRR